MELEVRAVDAAADASPRSSGSYDDDVKEDIKESPGSSMHSLPALPLPERAESPKPAAKPDASAPQPSLRLLFSLLSRRHIILLVLPAALLSAVSGGIAPFTTVVIGQSFNAFAQFPITPNPPPDAKHKLLHSVGIAALELIALATGSLVLSSITSSLWIWTGERNIMALRKRVYQAVTEKDMVWFDTKMGAEGTVQDAEGDDGPLGAGGLMAKFTRETDEVRMATSLAFGMIIQYLTTCLVCLILAFIKSWSLTLVILSAIPILMVIQGFSQGLTGPLLDIERTQTGAVATLVDRAVTAIATVKAFNAASYEHATISTVFDSLRAIGWRINGIWAVTSGMAQVVMMGMFVQGFWYGATLVRSGKVSAGDVMAVFWACLIATSNLQMCVPQMITLTKGKFSMVALLSLVDDATSPPPTTPPSRPPFTRSLGSKRLRRLTSIRKIVPERCEGEFALHSVTFAYPSRPTMPVLQDVSLFLPANEMTFIVGGSGSGKSTIAQLLLRMYNPQSGSVEMDNQDLSYLDEAWTRQHVAAVSQGCILFDMSVHDNVAMGLAGPGSGRRPQDATREEVIAACRAALIHEFIRDLPEGYDTKLGTGGANLSGGQKQRLAIARAQLRNPVVLILDEATSALDATSRVLVFEAIKRWRAGKTTIVITHDLSQISASDFVYVLKGGHVVEQGYRHDLEAVLDGEFHEMMATQGATGGYLPTKDVDGAPSSPYDEKPRLELQPVSEERKRSLDIKAPSIVVPTPDSLALGAWMFDVVADLTRTDSTDAAEVAAARQPKHLSRLLPLEEIATEEKRPAPLRRRPSTVFATAEVELPAPVHTAASRRLSLQIATTPPTYTLHKSRSIGGSTMLTLKDEAAKDKEKAGLERKGTVARRSVRLQHMKSFSRWEEEPAPSEPATVSEKEKPAEALVTPKATASTSFWMLIREVYPTVPYKPVVFLGILLCILNGATTPVFSFLLARLLYEVASGVQSMARINMYGGIVLGMAALDGAINGSKYFVMEVSATRWVSTVRKACVARVLAQDKKWFDKGAHSPVRVVQILVKDGDDARDLVSVVLGQGLVVVAMLAIGLVWALVVGWQLTLVGFAIAPVFVGVMALQTKLTAKCELRNKRAREEVAQGYYEAILNIRGIRAMAFESIFRTQYEATVDRALKTGVRGAFVEGCTLGVNSALIYLAEALLFYVGAVFVAHGTYTYLQMLQVLNLVVFSVTIASQLMGFTQKIAKAIQATRDFNELLKLSTDTDESHGSERPSLAGPISFKDVVFSYPERADTRVLDGVNLDIAEGECVAIVGSSGSGKSTIAALLQRLYEPQSGTITIGGTDLRSMDIEHLRRHVSVVSQNPHLFDASITANIAYGNSGLSDADVQAAARAANVHDFIMSLPAGYDTLVGENASLISGGQAQRLQIARALARPARVLILDECTSALDAANQAAVLDAVRAAKVGRTTMMVTHKLAVMRTCDRIVVVHGGRVAEAGTYEGLMARKGVFAQLASGGEWNAE